MIVDENYECGLPAQTVMEKIEIESVSMMTKPDCWNEIKTIKCCDIIILVLYI
jgi:hypothetical protein